MSHIKSLINNLINNRTDEAGLDAHNHIKVAMRKLVENPAVENVVKESLEAENNGDALCIALEKVAEGRNVELQDVEEDMTEAYITSNDKDGNHYRLCVYGEGMDGDSDAEVHYVTIEPYPFGVGDAKKLRVIGEFSLFEKDQLDKVASKIWAKIKPFCA